ncbi:hypothetical protein EJ08DRAFT_97494 [Tothia fuscella]|uniref:Uncharacterized protein n=1 Tax=Tothia fuscella TaxID=1048955 RepID=A0A9P4NE50_9PEZI|nr:hypothetical protein EJ08DRAFT_97494 [Tothia fuscella]
MVILSYVKLYNFIKDSHSAVQAAAAEINASPLFDKMISGLAPRPDTFGQVLGILADIAMPFIPFGGIELLTMKIVVKTLVKLAKKELKSAVKDALKNGDVTKADLQDFLASAVTSFQQALVDQHNQIFVSANPGIGQENPQFVWLSDGKQLDLAITAADLQKNMKDSLTNHLLAAFMNSHGGRVCEQVSITRDNLVNLEQHPFTNLQRQFVSFPRQRQD